MRKTVAVKIWRVVLGIAAEITMAISIMAVALGLCWVIVGSVK